jgi:hypothetical protein
MSEQDRNIGQELIEALEEALDHAEGKEMGARTTRLKRCGDAIIQQGQDVEDLPLKERIKHLETIPTLSE